MSMIGFDYKGVARQFGVNDDKKAKRLYAKALDITRKLAGDLPQNNLEKQFPKELMDNYQDLLQMSTDQNYRESVEGNNMKIKESREAVMKMGDIAFIKLHDAEGYNDQVEMIENSPRFRNVKQAQDFINTIPLPDMGYDKIRVRLGFNSGEIWDNFRYDHGKRDNSFSIQLMDYIDYSISKNKENSTMKNKTKIREYLDNDMPLDELINKYDLEEEESYSQSMINPNTKDYKGKKKDEGCGSEHRKEYAVDGKGANTGDLDGSNGYQTGYVQDGINGYNSTDNNQEILDAETVTDTNDGLDESTIKEMGGKSVFPILKQDTTDIVADNFKGLESYYLTFADRGEITIMTRDGSIKGKDITKGSPTATEFFTNVGDNDLASIDSAMLYM